MMAERIIKSDCVGLLRPALDVHTLGLTSLAQLLGECGCRCVIGNGEICSALDNLDGHENTESIERWILNKKITILGFSYRLDPEEGARLTRQLADVLLKKHLFHEQGGPLRAMYFGGLPKTCALVRAGVAEVKAVFEGDETTAEILGKFGIDSFSVPRSIAAGIRYDDDRLAFGREMIQKGNYLSIKPVDRSGYREFGTRQDTLAARMHHGVLNDLPPLMRAHVGPYLPDREEAVRLFLDWCEKLADSGFLDILSIGTSQLTQSNFGENWGGKPNGGGVPLNSREEFAAVGQCARPMLVRTYAGTKNIPELARMYEETINIAWHALSLWWFCQIDGRGPYSVRENLQQHLKTLRYIGSVGKPCEANVPHHFAFRGADDVTYVVSALIAAKVAKANGISDFILQNMLNTPKTTWGVQDLAKSRAMLELVGELEDARFRVILQPRGGLDYFSHDHEKAKAQLAAVTALMDDIEPDNSASPPVIHVVSYSEGSNLADPPTIDESIQITRHALKEYRRLRKRGDVDDMASDPEVVTRTAELLDEARVVIRAIEASVPDPYSAEGLYRILAEGYLPVPYLWECRDEFKRALRWQTRLTQGAVRIVDTNSKPVPAQTRLPGMEFAGIIRQ